MNASVQTYIPPEAETPGRSVATPMQMLETALASGASVEMMEKLLTLQERWEANAARKAFDAAMASAKADLPEIAKNRKVDFTSAKGRTNYRHEDLAEISRTVNPILSRHGLSYRYRTSQEGASVTVTCIVSHRDGYSEENTLSAGKDDSGNKNSIQAVGSTITYLQRYTLKAALGLAASNDDDGGKADRKPEAAITEDQLVELRDLVEAVDASEGRFARHMGVDALTDLPAKKYDAAVSELKAFGRRNGKDA